MGFKYDLNEKFFDEWSPSMAYLLGLVYADGSLENSPYIRGKYLRFTSTDQELVKIVKSLLEAEHPIVAIDPPTPKYQKKYFIRIGSHWLYNALETQGLTPRKSLTMLFPIIPTEFIGDFVRGYFDGDGCAYLDRKLNAATGEVNVRRLQIIFVSGSKAFLAELGRILQATLSLRNVPLYKHRRAFELRYGGSASIDIFKLMYANSSPQTRLGRKFAKFEEYFTLTPRKKDRKIAKLLTRVTWSSS